jgi:uncharacterized protein YndB with AHSA1/START domain
MAVDVETEIVIARPREEVAAFAADPDNATAWYENIKQVAWRTPPPLVVGSQVAFVAQFMGRRLAYTYEITEHVPGERLVMRTATWAPTRDGGTRMTLRNRGQPRGFARVGSPMMARAMRKATASDLARLKELLEARPG